MPPFLLSSQEWVKSILKNRVKIPTEFTLTNRSGAPQLLFRFRYNYLTFDHLRIEDKSISFIINNDPEVPATEDDLKIIQLAKQLLSEEKILE